MTDSDGTIVISGPERVRIAASGRFSGRVVRIDRTGPDAYVHVEGDAGRLLARVSTRDVPQLHAQVALDVADGDVVVYGND